MGVEILCPTWHRTLADKWYYSVYLSCGQVHFIFKMKGKFTNAAKNSLLFALLSHEKVLTIYLLQVPKP